MTDHNHTKIIGKSKTPFSRDRQNYLERKPFDMAQGEAALWRAVITQALMDASSHSSKKEAQYDKEAAQRWLLDNKDDFITVCQHGNLDPQYVRKMAKKALLNAAPWRAEAGKSARYEKDRQYKATARKQRIKQQTEEQQPANSSIILFKPWVPEAIA